MQPWHILGTRQPRAYRSIGGCGDDLAIGRHAEADDAVLVAAQRADLAMDGGFPTCRAVFIVARDGVRQYRPAIKLPDANQPIDASGHQIPAVGVERDCPHTLAVPTQDRDFGAAAQRRLGRIVAGPALGDAALHVPQSHRLIN